ncbi:MAG TPA: hypothetical protein VJV03_06175 [Pyrinomonadaceae bacterium]|nr:hypothetical protein [Pyrinomonadaceae bacterium]
MSDVNIHVSFGSEGEAGSSAGSRAAAVQSAAETEPARPMALEELTFGGGGEAPPTPLSAEELSTSSASSSGSSTPPVPMAIEQLQGSVASAAPEPSAFGSLVEAEAGGIPTPSLQALAETVEGAAPRPMSPEDLGTGATGKNPKK